jgi:hypothetical protein
VFENHDTISIVSSYFRLRSFKISDKVMAFILCLTMPCSGTLDQEMDKEMIIVSSFYFIHSTKYDSKLASPNLYLHWYTFARFHIADVPQIACQRNHRPETT